MKLKIVRLDWQPLDIKTLVLRNIVGLLLIESVSDCEPLFKTDVDSCDLGSILNIT